ncbi:MAG TPA: hypothetical protein VHB51_03015 [Candidatus Saccharimonadales bacterium]|nr:hypothetical protein [Candidatus Saccharimonadales bacterium]
MGRANKSGAEFRIPGKPGIDVSRVSLDNPELIREVAFALQRDSQPQPKTKRAYGRKNPPVNLEQQAAVVQNSLRRGRAIWAVRRLHLIDLPAAPPHVNGVIQTAKRLPKLYGQFRSPNCYLEKVHMPASQDDAGELAAAGLYLALQDFRADRLVIADKLKPVDKPGDPAQIALIDPLQAMLAPVHDVVPGEQVDNLSVANLQMALALRYPWLMSPHTRYRYNP